MKNWLKIACIVLLLYTVVFSFLRPLVPGLIGVDRQGIARGEQQFGIIGYNTHFESARESMHAVLEFDKDHRICCNIDEVSDQDRVTVSVVVPDTVSSTVAAVYVNNAVDGTIYFPNALSIQQVVLDKTCDVSTCTVDLVTETATVGGYPFQPIIFETIRNLMFHVPMWFTMFFLMILSFVNSLKYLRSHESRWDQKAYVSAKTGLLFCILGLITGSVWARFAWGAWWVKDPQLNGALVVFLIYAAYLVLRRSVTDDEKRARLAAIYNVFAFVMLVVLLMVLPRFNQSLHPGKSGNPAFSSYDLDSSLRAIFYPAVVGWILLGYWIYSINLRLNKLELSTDSQ